MTPTAPKSPVALEDRAREAAKLYSPSAARNKGPVADALVPRLPEGAHVLEIGSGTGEHGEACCLRRPDIAWQLSEIDPDSRASCAARADETENLLTPLALDATDAIWADGLPPADAVVSLNVIHIAPWAVARGLAAGAARVVKPGGLVFLYGPFMEGEATAPSNLGFDASLKSRNPDWGVRDLDAVKSLFQAQGFNFEDRIEMPANNLSLVFGRPA